MGQRIPVSATTTESMPPDVKPGVQTSEFYTPGILAIVGVLLEVVNKKFNLALQATDVVNAVIGIVTSIGAIIGWVTYISGRARVKSAALSR